jgi:acetyl esterase/lipase
MIAITMRKRRLVRRTHRLQRSTKRLYLSIVLLSFAVTGCSPIQLVNGLSPSSHYQLTADLAYGGAGRQNLDVYSPRAAPGSSPLVVFFYGGGWQDGRKKDYEFVASSLTKAGYVVIIPDYRLFPDVVFPEFVKDGAEAVAWALLNAGEHGAGTDKVFLMGHSAGAHIAALLITDQRYLAENSINVDQLKGFVGLSGPYDFLPIKSGYLLDVFPEHKREASQPINFVTAAAPPTLLVHGTDDKIVDPLNSKRLAKRLSAHGVDVTLKLYEGVGHAEVAAALAPPLDFTNETLEDVRTFLAARSGRPN